MSEHPEPRVGAAGEKLVEPLGADPRYRAAFVDEQAGGGALTLPCQGDRWLEKFMDVVKAAPPGPSMDHTWAVVSSVSRATLSSHS